MLKLCEVRNVRLDDITRLWICCDRFDRGRSGSGGFVAIGGAVCSRFTACHVGKEEGLICTS